MWFCSLAVLRGLIAADMVECLGIVISSHHHYAIGVEEDAQRIRDLLGPLGLKHVPVMVQDDKPHCNAFRDLYQSASSGADLNKAIHSHTVCPYTVPLNWLY